MKIGKGGGLKNATDVKIFILFLLNNIRYPITLDEIIELVTADGLVENFDFTACFSEIGRAHV